MRARIGMTRKTYTEAQKREAVAAFVVHGTLAAAAKACNIPWDGQSHLGRIVIRDGGAGFVTRFGRLMRLNFRPVIKKLSQIA